AAQQRPRGEWRAVDGRQHRLRAGPLGGGVRAAEPAGPEDRALRRRAPCRRALPATVTESSLARSTATITGWNSVSRITGFVRVLAVGAALGATFLGNTYQSSNLVSNILFELLAAGLISAPLVPAFVGMLQRSSRDDVERLSGSLLTIALVGLGAVVAIGLAAAPLIMRALTVGVADAAVRSRE